MRRFIGILTLTLACVSGIQAEDVGHESIQLLAHAVDIRTAIIAAPSGGKMRVAQGDNVPGTDLKLSFVDVAGVELRAAQTLRGEPFAVRLRDGESISLQRLNALRKEAWADAPHPTAVRPVRVPPVNQKQ